MKNHVRASIFLFHIWFCRVGTSDMFPLQELLSAVLCIFRILALCSVGSIAGSILCFVLVLLLVHVVSIVCIAVVVCVAAVCIVVIVLHNNLQSGNIE